MRFRITVRGTDIELRGYVDGAANTRFLAQGMEGLGIVVASVTDDDYNPFAISEPAHPPTLEASTDIIRQIWEQSQTPDEFLGGMAHLHFMQATVIRGERGRAEAAERELIARELHHFETEQIIEQALGYIDRFQEGDEWHGDIQELRRFLGDRKKAEAEQENERLKADHSYSEKALIDQVNDLTDRQSDAQRIREGLENNWEHGDLAGAVNDAIEFLTKLEGKDGWG